MTIGLAVTVLAILLVLAGLALAASRRHGRLDTTVPRSDALALEPREAFLTGINRNAACGTHRQKLIRQCRAGETLRLVRVTDDPRDPDAVAVYRADGRDIGTLPRKVAPEIAGYLDSGTPVAATIRAIEPHETDSGEMLSGVRLALTPYRMPQKR